MFAAKRWIAPRLVSTGTIMSHDDFRRSRHLRSMNRALFIEQYCDKIFKNFFFKYKLFIALTAILTVRRVRRLTRSVTITFKYVLRFNMNLH